MAPHSNWGVAMLHVQLELATAPAMVLAVHVHVCVTNPCVQATCRKVLIPSSISDYGNPYKLWSSAPHSCGRALSELFAGCSWAPKLLQN
jgi:hypothetical protein